MTISRKKGSIFMDDNEYLPPLSEKNIRIITDSIASAVGDEIAEDVQSKNLITQNGTPGRTWDFINSKIFKRFHGTSVIAKPTQRGGVGHSSNFQPRKRGSLLLYERKQFPPFTENGTEKTQ